MTRFAFICFDCRFQSAELRPENSRPQRLRKTGTAHGRHSQPGGSIEADVYLVDGKLMVAHDKSQIKPGRTLDSLYLKPIAMLFGENKSRQSASGTVSKDRKYSFQLMIDMKDNGVEAIKELEKAVAPYRTCFDRAMNPAAIQLVISGSRPPVATGSIIRVIFLSTVGRANSTMTKRSKHVALFSDTFLTYSRWNGEGEMPEKDRETLKRFIKRAHGQNKPMRFWAAPDNPNTWKQLAKIGVDYINTDKVEECATALK